MINDPKPLTLIGHLQLQEGERTGTVVARNTATKQIVAFTTVNQRGWFTLSDLPGGLDLKLWGFPGQEIEQQKIESAIASPPAIYYEAIVPPDAPDYSAVYLNGVSSIISARLTHAPSLSFAEASQQAKDYLFGKAASVFLPGYTPEFLGHIAAPSVYDPPTFLDEANKAGGVGKLVEQAALEMDNANNLRAFKNNVVKNLAISNASANLAVRKRLKSH